MKIGKKTVLLGMLVLLCSFSLGFMVQAKPADRIVIDFTYDMWVPEGAVPEREWFSDEGIYQARATPHVGIVTWSDSDFYGNFIYIGNVWLDFATYDGSGGGYFDFTGNYGEGTAVGFVGKMHFKIKGGYLTGTFNVFGSGAWEGLHLKGTLEGPLGGSYDAQLIIWN